MKSGIKTTEFLLTVVASIVAVLIGGGVLSPDEGAALQSTTAEVIKAVAELATVLGPIIGAGVYTWSRTRVKQANGK